MDDSHVVVLGASLAGMHTAHALAERGFDVTILDRDSAPPTADPLDWVRPGTPQLQHSHAFLGRYVQHLRTRCPGLLDELLDAGGRLIRRIERLPAPIADRAPRPEDDELVVLNCRRAVLDGVVRRYVERHPRVRIETGVAARGLAVTDAALPHVTGVVTDDRTWSAALVVDASGRRTRVPRWLADAGITIDDGAAAPCGNVYYTRHYRELPGAEPQSYAVGFVEPSFLDAMAMVAFPGEHDTFTISMQIDDDDAALRVLQHPAAFEAAAGAVPAFAPRVDPTRVVPLSGVLVMAGLQNRLRRLVVDDRPVVTGLAVLGDALCVTNPTFGRGSGHAVILAEAVADAFTGEADEGLTRAVDDATSRGIAPYFRNALAQDTLTRSRWRAVLYGEEPALDPGLEAHARAWEQAFLAGFTDRDVWAGVARSGNLLQSPDEMLADPRVAAGIAAAVERGLPSMPPGRTRADVLSAVSAVSAVAVG
ncbi:MAG TPA: NAD(P)-binding protein [Mycobacteriales bacterium]|nr:NAD(P)-binding protein [Mycobacteriales bacterium]